MGNFVKKQIAVKTPQGMAKKLVDVIPHVIRERLTISADTGTVIEFHLPKERNGYVKNYQPGPQNMFKANEGFILKADTGVYDVDGVAVSALSNSAWNNKLAKFYKALSMARVIHRFNEQDRIIDDIEGYFPALPVLVSSGSPAVTGGSPAQSTEHNELLQLNKIGNKLSSIGSQTGYIYPGDGLYVSNKDQWSFRIELKEPFHADCYGMVIDSILTTHRLAQESR